MWRSFVFFSAVVSSLGASPIVEYPLNPYKALDLIISREVTTITFPGAITAVAAADMLIESGKESGVEVDPSTPLRFQVTHPPGANFILVRSLLPTAAGRLTVIFEEAAYVLQLSSVVQGSVASVIFKRTPVPGTPRIVLRPPEPVAFTPRIGLSLLDRARAYPVLVVSLPHVVEGVTRIASPRVLELPDLVITVREVVRFTKEDAVVFLLSLRNTTEHTLDVAPSTLAARVANERFPQAIAHGPQVLAPGEEREAEFAIVGMTDGTRNDLSAENAFTILVNTARRESKALSSPEGGPSS